MRHTKELLKAAISNSNQWAEVARQLGVKPFTGAQSYLKKRAVHFGIDFSHFGGKGAKGTAKFGKRKSISDYLHKGSHAKSNWIKYKLIQAGIKEHRCEWCGGTEWMDRPMPLELDHINDDHWDNRIENLQILCSNCHSQKHKPL